MNILNKVNSSNDIKMLDVKELEPLCKELRQFIIENVSKTGGHLASNLGAVELTVALHRVYDSTRDSIMSFNILVDIHKYIFDRHSKLIFYKPFKSHMRRC